MLKMETKQEKIINNKIVKSTSSFFRPNFVLGFELSSIVFYDEEGIYYKSSSGWLEHERQDVVKIELKNSVIRKIKETFKTKDNYVLKRNDEDRGFRDSYYRLYIYLPRSNVIEEKEVLDWENETEKHFKTLLTIKGLKFWVRYDKEDEKPKQQIILTTNYRTELKKTGKKIKEMMNFFKEKGLIDRYNYDVNKVCEYMVLNKKEFLKHFN